MAKGVGVRVRLLGLPGGSPYRDVALDTGTLGELTDWVASVLAAPAGVSLKDAAGKLDDSLSIVRDGGVWVDPAQTSLLLAEGDEITYFVVLAGG